MGHNSSARDKLVGARMQVSAPSASLAIPAPSASGTTLSANLSMETRPRSRSGQKSARRASSKEVLKQMMTCISTTLPHLIPILKTKDSASLSVKRNPIQDILASQARTTVEEEQKSKFHNTNSVNTALDEKREKLKAKLQLEKDNNAKLSKEILLLKKENQHLREQLGMI